jgi:hypothetical protein
MRSKGSKQGRKPPKNLTLRSPKPRRENLPNLMKMRKRNKNPREG